MRFYELLAFLKVQSAQVLSDLSQGLQDLSRWLDAQTSAPERRVADQTQQRLGVTLDTLWLGWSDRLDRLTLRLPQSLRSRLTPPRLSGVLAAILVIAGLWWRSPQGLAQSPHLSQPESPPTLQPTVSPLVRTPPLSAPLVPALPAGPVAAPSASFPPQQPSPAPDQPDDSLTTIPLTLSAQADEFPVKTELGTKPELGTKFEVETTPELGTQSEVGAKTEAEDQTQTKVETQAEIQTREESNIAVLPGLPQPPVPWPELLPPSLSPNPSPSLEATNRTTAPESIAAPTDPLSLPATPSPAFRPEAPNPEASPAEVLQPEKPAPEMAPEAEAPTESLQPEASQPENFPLETAQTVDAQTVDTQTVDAQTVDAQTVDAQTVDAQTIDAQTVDAQTVDAQTVDGQTEAPPAETSPPGPLTPEQRLTAALAEQLQTLAEQQTDPLTYRLIAKMQANLATNSLVLTLQPDWYGLDSDRQDAIAQQLLSQAQQLSFSKLILQDLQGNPIARNSFIGNNIIILSRSLN